MAIMKHFKKRWVQIMLAITLVLALFAWLTPSKNAVKGTRFVIAKDAAWQLVELYDKENIISALVDEFINSVAKAGEFSVQIVNTSSDRLIKGLRDKVFDGILIPVIERPTLEMRDLTFSQSFFALGPVLVLKKESPDMTPETIGTKQIGIEQSSSILTHLYKYPGLGVQIFPNYHVGLENLSQNKIDALIIDALPAYLQIESRYKGQLRIQSPSLTKGGIKLVTLDVKRGDKLIETFNTILKASFENGGYQNLLNRWGFTGYPQPLFKTVKEDTAEDVDNV